MYTPFFQSSTTTQDWVSKPPKHINLIFAIYYQYYENVPGQLRYINLNITSAQILFNFTIGYKNPDSSNWIDIISGNIIDDVPGSKNYSSIYRIYSADGDLVQNYIFNLQPEIYNNIKPNTQYKLYGAFRPTLKVHAYSQDESKEVDLLMADEKSSIHLGYFLGKKLDNQDMSNLIKYNAMKDTNNDILRYSLVEEYANEEMYHKNIIQNYSKPYTISSKPVNYLGYQNIFKNGFDTSISNLKSTVTIRDNELPSVNFAYIQNSLDNDEAWLNIVFIFKPEEPEPKETK